MNRLVSAVCAAALLVATCCAQGQDSQTMSLPEFRQVLVDLGSYLDSHRNTNLRQQFEAAPDEILQRFLSVAVNPRQLQSSVARLKEYDATHTGKMTSSGPITNAAYPSCTYDTIIDTAPGAACTPAYPDPTNAAWQNLVNPLIPLGAFSPTDYASVSSQACSLTVESNLSQTASVLQGTVLAASSICGALTALPVAAAICWSVNAAFSLADAVSYGLFADCIEQDSRVNAAEIDAAFHNTVTVYNALVALFNQLSTQLTNSTDLATAQQKQVMRLLLQPDGLKVIDPAILTCTGANCPNVLGACPATATHWAGQGGCSWNNVGPP